MNSEDMKRMAFIYDSNKHFLAMKKESIGSQIVTKGPSHPQRFRSIEDNLKPILISMKTVGMYFDPVSAGNKIDDSENYSPKRKRSGLLALFTNRIYCVIVLLLLWFNLIRCVVSFFPFDGSLHYRVPMCIWFLHCAVNATIMFAACQRLRHFHSFYKHWDTLFTNSVTKNISLRFMCPGAYLKIATVIGWILFVLNNIVFDVLLILDTPSTKVLIANLVRPFPKEQWSLILTAVLCAFCTGAWIFPVIFLSIISRVIQVQFLHFKACLSKQIDEAEGCIPDRLPELRCCYTQLCETIDIINNTWKWMLGMSFILDIFMACFLSYLLINHSPDISNIITNLFWIGSAFLVLILLAISCSRVNDAAHSLLDVIFRVGTKNATSEQLGQLGGLYITYFFILLQFRIS